MFEGGFLVAAMACRWGVVVRSGTLRGEEGDHAPRAAAGRHTSRRRLWNVKTTTPSKPCCWSMDSHFSTGMLSTWRGQSVLSRTNCWNLALSSALLPG